ncbi:MAG: BatD family protein, partial [Pseudomonadota bacterium]
SIINSRMSSKVEYNYMLYPQKTGVFTLGPFTIQYKGETVKSNQISVTIEKSQAVEKENSDIFVTAQVDNDSPYLNEQIICTLLFCRRLKIANASLTEQPSFEGFITEDLGKEKEYQKLINGQTYIVTEIKKALFPIKTGVLEISPFILQCEVVVQKSRGRGGSPQDPFFSDSFFGFTETVPKTLRTSPVTVMVKPLPAEGRPGNYKNLVGDFSLTSELNKIKLDAGESTTLTLTITGTGNLKNLQTIDISGLDNFKVYDDKPVFEQSIAGGKVGGRLIVKKALVPLAAGQLKLPQVTLSYFSPSSGSYKTAAGGSYTLQVSPSQDKERLTVVEPARVQAGAKEEVKVLGKDILPIHTSLAALSSTNVQPLELLTGILFFLPMLSFFCIFSVQRVRERRAGYSSIMRSKKAYERFTKELPEIKKNISGDDAAFYQLASKACKEFIGDKLNIAGNARTTKELEAVLSEAQVTDEIKSEIAALIDFFDSGQFGFKKHSRDEKDAAFKSLKKMAGVLDKKIKAVKLKA